MITYQEEKFSLVKNEMLPLLERHWGEVEESKEAFPFEIDVELYGKMEEMGFLSLTTARKDGNIVGYFSYLVFPSLHHKRVRMAEGDAFYVDKAHRGIARQLLRHAEGNVIKMGVNAITHKVKENFKNSRGRGAEVLFKGYKKVESLYIKLV